MFCRKRKEKKEKKEYVGEVLARFSNLVTRDLDNITNIECERSDIFSGKTTSVYWVKFTFKRVCYKSWKFFVVNDTLEVLTEREFKDRCSSMKTGREE